MRERSITRPSLQSARPATNGDPHVVLSCEVHRGDHIGDARAARDGAGALQRASVPDLACVFVGGVRGSNDLAKKRRAELLETGLVNGRAVRVHQGFNRHGITSRETYVAWLGSGIIAAGQVSRR